MRMRVASASRSSSVRGHSLCQPNLPYPLPWRTPYEEVKQTNGLRLCRTLNLALVALAVSRPQWLEVTAIFGLGWRALSVTERDQACQDSNASRRRDSERLISCANAPSSAVFLNSPCDCFC